MIKLGLPRQRYWIDLGFGVRVEVRPLTTALYEAASARGRRMARSLAQQQSDALAAGVEVDAIDGIGDLRDPDTLAGVSQMLFVQALAVGAIVAWEGVADADGNPAALTEANVCELMRISRMAERFAIEYTQFHAALAAEGNASAPGPNGTSTTGANTATGAEPKVSRAPEANQAPTVSGAHTSSTSR